VTLVDRATHHLFQPLLYQVSTGILAEGEIAPPLRGVLRRQANARVLLAEVTGFDLDARGVAATGPAGEPMTLEYDSLIVAAGAGHSYFGHEEWTPLAPGLKTLDDARRLRSRILRAFEQAELADGPEERAAWLRFAVVGAGPTGIEVSGQIAELGVPDAASRLPHDRHRGSEHLAARGGSRRPRRLPRRAARPRRKGPREAGRRRARRPPGGRRGRRGCGDGRARRGVAPRARSHGHLGGGRRGVAAGAAARGGGRRGRRSRGPAGGARGPHRAGHANVFAVGDMVALDSVPGIAPAAMQQGRHAARAIRRGLDGKPPARFAYFDKGQLAVVGHDRAVGHCGVASAR
jgi:NADH dehydrogenase